ncbi:hypothetical protein BD410DRAFT_791068 [Rickenella mellea]|uniref:Secreted protein n=1 Tax=Rickenella mellea TaxID=50990 RepID=A0A4Y7Q0H0_9AGAM|nr:hypothetical protein BD410DRAFT_791068 [Rickenella mellea]
MGSARFCLRLWLRSAVLLSVSSSFCSRIHKFDACSPHLICVHRFQLELVVWADRRLYGEPNLFARPLKAPVLLF